MVYFKYIALLSLLFCLSASPVYGLIIAQEDLIWDGNRQAPFTHHQQIQDDMVFDGVNLTIRAGTWVYHERTLTDDGEEFAGDPRGPFFLLFINGATLNVEGSEDLPVVFGRPVQGRSDPGSSYLYLHFESPEGMADVSDISISHAEFWWGASMNRSNPNENQTLIEEHLGLEWNPDQPLEYFSKNTEYQKIYLNINHLNEHSPIFNHCYLSHLKIVLHGTGHGNEYEPDLYHCEFFCPEAAAGGAAEYSPDFYHLAIGNSHPGHVAKAENFVVSDCEFYNSLDGEVNNQILQVSAEYVEDRPNIIKNCYFHHAHESLVHVFSGRVIFKNSYFEHTSDACLKQVTRGYDNRCLVEVYNCLFRYFGDHSVFMDAPESDNFQLIMKN